MKSKLGIWSFKYLRTLGIIFAIVVGAMIVLILIRLGYNIDWTGFNRHVDAIPQGNQEQPVKTLWDWMQLLVVPIVLALGAFLLNLAVNRTEQKITEQRYQNDQKIASDKQREDLLQGYFDRMSDLLLKEGLRTSRPDAEVRNLARVRTLTVLTQLDTTRTNHVLSFLREAKLVSPKPEESIVTFSGADFRGADLKHINLSSVDLSKANLSGADLTGANLKEANLTGANLWRAILDGTVFNGAILCKANLHEVQIKGFRFFNEADLSGADLSFVDLSVARLNRAILRGANLRGANLNHAHLNQADLSEANLIKVDFSWADLREANLSEADLREAVLRKASLKKAVLSKAKLHQRDLQNVDLTEDQLEGLMLTEEPLSLADLFVL